MARIMRTPVDAGKAELHGREMETTKVQDRITQTLTKAFQPVALEVVDESDHHKGHAGWRPDGGTHFRVRIVSAAFRGKSRLDIHRQVNAALAEELAGGVHALAIEARPPSDQGD